MATGPLRQGASLRSGGGEREEAAPDWASLHVELTQLISARVLTMGGSLDYLRFCAVCSHWRATTASPIGRALLDPRFHPRCWMLFPEGEGEVKRRKKPSRESASATSSSSSSGAPTSPAMDPAGVVRKDGERSAVEVPASVWGRAPSHGAGRSGGGDPGS